MSRFLQLHSLISYPPSNLNRDDLGRPKTAVMGGALRLRVSSQSLKRAWRTSDVFAEKLGSQIGQAEGKLGTRTKQLGSQAYAAFKLAGFSDKLAGECAEKLATVYGALKKDSSYDIEQLVHVSPSEIERLQQLQATLIAEKRAPTSEELDALLGQRSAVDIALFGRMLASKPDHNVEAAVQVAHAISIHPCVPEDDFFTAVDDLNRNDPGAAHLGEAQFGAAVFYQYICINREQLQASLGDAQLVNQAIQALIESALTVAPSGKQNSYGSRAYAHYALLERGNRQPRSLSLAFLQPLTGQQQADAGIAALRRTREHMDQVYGACAEAHREFNVLAGEGSLRSMLDFAAE
ncbi:type I-E CRISPR-associated protein Cas7/Cse4/CasC [Leeia sp.]|uniref:type I-E CRISPR-associated protein Cas7/Cse4/CasC n=1 Tax=Leeia sp. TaxID=2884678 RepID=UPI0035B0FBB2